MKQDSILRLTLCAYLLSSAALPHMIFNANLPLEALNYMQIVGEANSGIDLANFLSKILFIMGNIVGLIGGILIFIKKNSGAKPFIIGGLLAFLGLIGLLPKYMPSVFTTQAIVLLSAHFYIFGLATAIAVKNPRVEANNKPR